MRIVVKFAGALLEDADTVRDLAAHVANLAHHGHEILVVHGGGRLFTATLKRLGIESKFVAGLRVTDRETRDAGVMVFAGLLNKRLAAAITAAGQPAVGISAADANAFSAAPLVHNDVEGSLGFVGYLTSVNTRLLESLWREKLLPVAACLGLGADGELYNINADHMAAASAEFICADHLVYLTDVAGVLDGEKVLSAISIEEINRLSCPAAWSSSWKRPNARSRAACAKCASWVACPPPQRSTRHSSRPMRLRGFLIFPARASCEIPLPRATPPWPRFKFRILGEHRS